MSAALATPILIMDDLPGAASRLGDELVARLKEWRPDVRVCFEIEGVDKEMMNMGRSEAVFILDLDMGAGHERAGLDTIRSVDALRKQDKLPYYIVALTTHSELEDASYEAGTDVFLTKAASETIDALEVVTRLEWRRAERMLAIARENQKDLAKNEYEQLLRRLRHLQKGEMQYLTRALASIARALNWPFLAADDATVLSMLRGPLLRAEETRSITPEIVSLAVEGVELLGTESISEALPGWVSRMEQASPHSVPRWLSAEDPAILPDWEL